MPILVKIGLWMLVAVTGGLMLYHGLRGINCAKRFRLEDGGVHMRKMVFWAAISFIILHVVHYL
jgi:hypothetical protein